MSVASPGRASGISTRSLRRLAECALFAGGLLFLGLSLSSYFKFQHFQKETAALSPPSIPRAQLADHHPVIGQLQVRRLGLNVSILEGDDEESLALAAGHMSGTVFAGERGNMIVSGHRDTAFWPLRNVRKGDRIEVKSGSRATYKVEQIAVVNPDDSSLLADTQMPTLTLVTCYPFRHVGPAPQRFVVRAKLLNQ